MNRIGRRKEGGRGRMVLWGTVLALSLSLPALLPLFAAAQEDSVLPGSGIRFPGGFDPNTVGEVAGRAHGFLEPAEGPVRFQLAGERETYTVLLSPPWYWRDLATPFPDGEEVVVSGSKSLGKDGNLYIIAQEVTHRSSGEILFFRDKDGFPLWSGHGARWRTRPGGPGLPGRRLGGPGGGGGRR